MKKAISLILALTIVIGIGSASFGTVAEHLDLGKSKAISGTVKTKTSTQNISATSYSEQATGMFNRINEIRVSKGLHKLRRATELEPAAKQRGLEITVLFSHTRPDGTKWSTVQKGTNGENVGYAMDDYYGTTGGYPGADGFMESPDHRTNILDKDFYGLEVYCLERNDGLYWVQLFTAAKETPNTDSNTTTDTPSANTTPASGSQNDIVNAVKQAAVIDGKKSVFLKDNDVLNASTIASLKAAAGKTPAVIVADTTKNKSLKGRMTINLNSLTKTNVDIKLGVHTDNNIATKTKTKFENWYKNDVVVISLDHKGSFGGSVNIAAKLDTSKLDTKNLVFYSYDSVANKYDIITNTNYFVDRNGYLQFSTSVGGDIIVTDKALTK